MMAAIGTEVGFGCTDADLDCLARSLPEWPIFPDVAGALSALTTRYKLAVISNVDGDLFAGTAAVLNVDFDAIVTAEQAGSYSPARTTSAWPRNGWLCKRTPGCTSQRACTTTSRRQPARIRCVRVNRPDRGGGTRRTDAVPELVVPDLAALARQPMDHPAGMCGK